jgi:hypothetical protein
VIGTTPFLFLTGHNTKDKSGEGGEEKKRLQAEEKRVKAQEKREMEKEEERKDSRDAIIFIGKGVVLLGSQRGFGNR